jgi:small subunit ribosomal protein S11
MKKVKSKKKIKKIVKKGQAHIQATYNNTIVTITDPQGNVLAWSSAGVNGFKGPKKATPYAAGIIVRNVAEKIKDFNMSSVDVFVKGVGAGREASIRALHGNGLNINSIQDQTPIPHNGCRPKKPRRV